MRIALGSTRVRTHRTRGNDIEGASEAQFQPFGSDAHPGARVVEVFHAKPGAGHVGRAGRTRARTRQLPDQRKSAAQACSTPLERGFTQPLPPGSSPAEIFRGDAICQNKGRSRGRREPEVLSVGDGTAFGVKVDLRVRQKHADLRLVVQA